MANAYHGLFVDWDNTGSFSVGTLSATNIVTAVSGQNSTTYMIVNSADVSPMAKGQYVLWQSGSTPLGEGHVRMVMDVSTPFAGFVNISVFPPFPTVPATNDTLTQVTAFTGDDVTADRLASDLRIRIGRDVARSTAAIAPGTMDFELDNSSGDYMPDKASSPLTGKVLPGRPVKFVVSYNGTTYVLFRGYTDDYKITGSTVPGGSNGSVAITCTDVLSRVHAEKRLSTPLYESIRTGAAIGIILDQIGWSSGARDIDLGGTVINYWWEEGTEAWEAIQKIVRSEGPPALVTSDANGNFVFRDRHHRALDTRSKTVQATFRDSSGLTAVQWSRPLEYDYGYDALCNSVTFIVQERRPTNGPVEVWSTDSPFSVPASGSTPITISASEPFKNAITPTRSFIDDDGGDYFIMNGSITSVTLSRTNGAGLVITFFAGAGGATIGRARLRATSIPVARETPITTEDAASIAQYGRKTWGENAEWANVHDALAVGQLIVAQRKQRPSLVTVKIVDVNDVNRLQVLARGLSDRITLIASEFGLSADFYIEQIEWTISGRGQGNMIHQAQFSCEEVGTQLDNPVNLWVLGTSALGTGALGH